MLGLNTNKRNQILVGKGDNLLEEVGVAESPGGCEALAWSSDE